MVCGGTGATRAVIYLALPEVLHIAERTGGEPAVRDIGLLKLAVARPQATAFRSDACPDLEAKAASLLHWLDDNYAPADGKERLALAWPVLSLL